MIQQPFSYEDQNRGQKLCLDFLQSGSQFDKGSQACCQLGWWKWFSQLLRSTSIYHKALDILDADEEIV